MVSAKPRQTDNEAKSRLRKNTQTRRAFAARKALIQNEKLQRSDHEFRLCLSPLAQKACAIVSKIRFSERGTIWKNEAELFPGMMFNVAKGHMESTKLWDIVRRMPKGALLHAHLGATVDLEWLFNTAIDTPGICISASQPLNFQQARDCAIVRLRYSNSPDTDAQSVWSPGYPENASIPLKIAADSFPNGGRSGFVQWLKIRCSITKADTLEHHLGVDDVWRKMNQSFALLGPVVHYEPIFRRFLRKLFTTLLEDKVRWVELRTAFTIPFTLEGQLAPITNPEPMLRILDEEIRDFAISEEGRDFWGARVIWTSMRGFATDKLVEDMTNCLIVKRKYPHMIAGYDVVGPEDLGRTLNDLTPELLWFQEQCITRGFEIPFFFHAGETLGDGTDTDENLFDAVLLGSRRIGHAFSLYKHPLLIDMVKEKKILVECCPISNEALRYTASILSHPLPALLARGVPAALSNDDPAVFGQETSGMTHDFWQALQGWENLGLAGLGSLAENSVRWAVFEDEGDQQWLQNIESGASGETVRARRMQEWYVEWEDFCKWVVEEYGPGFPVESPRSCSSNNPPAAYGG